jgi:hypothetical protein
VIKTLERFEYKIDADFAPAPMLPELAYPSALFVDLTLDLLRQVMCSLV